MRYKRVYLKESLDSSLPYWLRKELDPQNKSPYNNQDLKKILVNKHIALDKVKFIQSDFPSSSNQVTKMKQQNKYPIFYVNNRDVYMPGIYGDERWFDARRTFKYTPMKDIIASSTDFGYIDLNDASNTSLDIRDQRKLSKKDMIDRKKGQYLNKLTKYVNGYMDPTTHKWVPGRYEETGEQEWITPKGYDKSGYLLNPDKYKNMLDDINLNNYSIVLDRYYNKLNTLKSKIQDELSNWDIKSKAPRFGDWGYSLPNILSDFEQTSNLYNQLLQSIEKIVNKDDLDDNKKREYIKDYADDYYGIKNIRKNIEDIEEKLKKEYHIYEV